MFDCVSARSFPDRDQAVLQECIERRQRDRVQKRPVGRHGAFIEDDTTPSGYIDLSYDQDGDGIQDLGDRAAAEGGQSREQVMQRAAQGVDVGARVDAEELQRWMASGRRWGWQSPAPIGTT